MPQAPVPAPAPAHAPARPARNRNAFPQTSWLKIVVTLLLGFQLGLLLGFISSSLLFHLLPPQWVNNGFMDRRERYRGIMDRRACRREGFREVYWGEANMVQICACWQDGAARGVDGGEGSCVSWERAGWGELGYS